MRSIREFIVYTDVVYNETFKTKGGLELYGSKNFSQKRLAQREVVIKAMPMEYSGKDITGWQALIDPTIYFQNIYDHGLGDNNQIEGCKGYFTVQPNMILAIRIDSQSEWIGFDQNILVRKVMNKNEDETTSSGIVLKVAKPEPEKCMAEIVAPNDDLLSDGIEKGDKILYNDYYWVDVFMPNGDELAWIRTKDVLGKIVES